MLYIQNVMWHNWLIMLYINIHILREPSLYGIIPLILLIFNRYWITEFFSNIASVSSGHKRWIHFASIVQSELHNILSEIFFKLLILRDFLLQSFKTMTYFLLLLLFCSYSYYFSRSLRKVQMYNVSVKF